MDLKQLLTEAYKQKASDIHLVSGEPPVFRINGEITRQHEKVLRGDEIHEMVISVMNEDQINKFSEEFEIDFAIEIENVSRFRVNAYKNSRGYGAVFRIIPSEILSFETLGLPEQLKRITEYTKGLILVTGPTGSGKSTTLAAILDLINESTRKHIITIEDPVEFVHQSKKCLVHHREVGTHTLSFADALKAALREDPDIVLVGEMRDLETIALALTAAETGILVFGTLHTSSAAKTANRIIDVFPAEEQSQIRSMFADSMEAIVSQTLLKRSDIKGRVAAVEILFNNVAIRNMIRENNIHQINSALDTHSQEGMQSLDMHLYRLFKDNKISKEEALKHVSDPEVLNKKERNPNPT